MGDELYVVYMKNGLDADDFLNNDSIRQETHQDILTRIKEHYEQFDFPYLALFPEGLTVILEDPGAYQLCGVDKLREPLEDYIDRFRIGNETIYHGQITPITAVVEFSPEEIYPEVMDKLAKKYEIHRISVE